MLRWWDLRFYLGAVLLGTALICRSPSPCMCSCERRVFLQDSTCRPARWPCASWPSTAPQWEPEQTWTRAGEKQSFSVKFPSDFELEASCSEQPGSLVLPTPPNSTLLLVCGGGEGEATGMRRAPSPATALLVVCNSKKPGGCVGVPRCVG